jgi:transcriptional regulator with XRE-family HTH domain
MQNLLIKGYNREVYASLYHTEAQMESTIPEKIDEKCRQLGINYRELGELYGISKTDVGRLVRGYYRTYSTRVIVALAKMLGTTPSVILEWIGEWKVDSLEDEADELVKMFVNRLDTLPPEGKMRVIQRANTLIDREKVKLTRLNRH